MFISANADPEAKRKNALYIALKLHNLNYCFKTKVYQPISFIEIKKNIFSLGK